MYSSKELSVTVLRAIGAAFLAKWTFSAVSSLALFFRSYYLQSRQNVWNSLIGYKRYSRYAVITGPARGLGKYFALKLAELGFSLVLIGRSMEKLKQCEQEIVAVHPDCRFVLIEADLEADLTDFKPFDILSTLDIAVIVNNAGLIHEVPTALIASNVEFLRHIVAVNCFAPSLILYNALKKSLTAKPLLVVNIGSVAAAYPLPLQGIYSASKQFVAFLSKVLAVEAGGGAYDNVVFALLTPSYIQTDMTAYWYKKPTLSCPSAEGFVDSALSSMGSRVRPSHFNSSLPFVKLAGWPEHELEAFFMTLGGELSYSLGGLLLHKYRRWRLAL